MNRILMLLLAADLNSAATPDIVLLDFTASYCQPCQMMLPRLQKMEQDGYPVRRIDISQEQQLPRQFQVDRLPTLIVLVNGKEHRRFVGLTSAAELRQSMDEAAEQLRLSRGSAASSPGKESQRNSGESAETDDSASFPGEAMTGVKSANGEKGRRGLGDVFRGIFRRDDRSGDGSAEPEAIRAQSDDSRLPVEDARRLAEAATVRVKVTGAKLQDVGTGTIVYCAENDAVVLTCAHLFEKGQEKSAKVEVDAFIDGKVARFPGRMVGGSHDSDIAFIKIQTGRQLPCVKLYSEPATVTPGQPVFSYGCNNGEPPTLLTANVLKVNPYLGATNLTCSRDPVQGRSGGGLFSRSGELLAVCSGAFRKEKEGLYMSQPAIIALVNRLKLDHLLMPRPETVGEEASLALAESAGSPSPDAASSNDTAEQSSVEENATPEETESAPEKAAMFDEDTAAASSTDSKAPVFEEVAREPIAAKSAGRSGRGGIREGRDADFGEDSFADQEAAEERSEGSDEQSPLDGDDGSSLRGSFAEAERMARAGSGRSSAPATRSPENMPTSVTEAGAGTEVTVVINSKDGGMSQRTIVIPNASPYLLELLTGEKKADSAVPQVVPTSVGKKLTRKSRVASVRQKAESDR
ncbi:MAG: trypsin-like peptidase domain-containing protein [Planctomyces sp.]